MPLFTKEYARALAWASVFFGVVVSHADPRMPADLALRSELQGKPFQAVVFVSPRCPCSKSHEKSLQELARRFPQVGFIGIHANANEPESESREYFSKNSIGFPVLEEPKREWLVDLPALKTPHVFVFSGDAHELRYQGGVDNSHTVENASKFYLKDVLEDLVAGHKARWSETRVLGCVISREEHE